MKRISLRLLIALVTFTVGVAAALWFLSERTPENLTQESLSSIPRGWVTDDLWGFSMSLPPDMRRRDIQGTDSSIREYRNDNLRVEVTYGITGDLFFEYFEAGQPEFREEEVEINGRKARWCTFRLDKSKADYFGDEGRPYVVEMYFPWPKSESRPIFLATGKSPAEQELAKQIFRTFKFK